MNPAQVGRNVMARPGNPYIGDVAAEPALPFPLQTVGDNLTVLAEDIDRCRHLCAQLRERLSVVLPEPTPVSTEGLNKTTKSRSPYVERIQHMDRELGEACTVLVYLLERIEL